MNYDPPGFLAGFFDAHAPQSMTRLVAFGCLMGMAALVLAADVLAVAYAWAIFHGKTAADPSGTVAALGVPMVGLAGAAYGALKQRTTGNTDARLTTAMPAVKGDG